MPFRISNLEKDKREKMKEDCVAIVLAAGRGRRMGSKIHKQYLDLGGQPVLYYTLKVFQKSDIIDSIILVTGKDEKNWVKEKIVDANGFHKVQEITEGGRERYDSVWNALQIIDRVTQKQNSFVFIHDGARPFVDESMLERLYKEVKKSGACVAGMPVKDTIKLVNDNLEAEVTPDRKKMWMVQTPQVFLASLIIEAYRKMMSADHKNVTDDAMAVEMMMNHPVKMVEGSYKNIKITTPEDLDIAEVFLQ